jgi:hypothetical protein
MLQDDEACIINVYYMASITSGEMANCDWLRDSFSGPFYSVMGNGHYGKKFRLAANESRFHVYTFDKIKQIKDNT